MYQFYSTLFSKAYSGTEVLANLFEFSRQQMEKRYPIMITFINHINPRSYEAHTRKLGLDVIKNFDFNNNHYYELGYDMKKKTLGSTI